MNVKVTSTRMKHDVILTTTSMKINKKDLISKGEPTHPNLF